VRKADIVFVVDSSGSIRGNWPLVTDYVVRYIKALGTNVGKEKVRLGFVWFSRTATIYFHLNKYFSGGPMINDIKRYVTITVTTCTTAAAGMMITLNAKCSSGKYPQFYTNSQGCRPPLLECALGLTC